LGLAEQGTFGETTEEGWFPMPTDGDGATKPETTRCPVCNEGDLVEITYERGGEVEPTLQPDSVEVQVFSCGHRVSGARLAGADQDRLNVERRTSEDTVDPLPEDTGETGSDEQAAAP
jgi:hypothetical protein